MRHRQKGMIFVVLAMALLAPLLLQAGVAKGETSLGRITGILTDLNAIERSFPITGSAFILEASSAVEVAKVTVENSSFDSGMMIPAGSYRIRFEVYGDGGNFSGFYRNENSSSCFVDATPVIVSPQGTTTVDQSIILVPAIIVANSWINFEGRVVDSQGRPLPGIHVTMIGTCKAELIFIEKPIISSEEGTFSIVLGIGNHGLDQSSRLRFSDPSGTYRSGYCATQGGVQSLVDEFLVGSSFPFNAEYSIGDVVLRWGALDLAPTALSFGEVALPGSKLQMVTASNVSSGTLTITGIAINPGSSSDFYMSSALTLPMTLNPGDNVDIALTYTPHALGPATETTLAITATSEGSEGHQLTVKLDGAGVASNAAPAEQITDIVNYIEGSVAQGTLAGTGPTGGANAKVKVLLNQITSAWDMWAKGQSKAACQQLFNAMQRTDGNPQPPDFVEGPAAAELELLIQITLQQMGCN